MRSRRLLRLGVLFLLALLGTWLLTTQSEVNPETVARESAMRALLPGSAPSFYSADTEPDRADSPLAPAAAVEVNLSEIAIDNDHPDSMYQRWIDGEIDLETEYVVSDAEWARMQEEALNQGPTPGVQNLDDPGIESVSWNQIAGWESMDYPDGGGSVPPDPEMAAGPNHVVATVNVAIAMYDKSGTLVFGPAPARNLFTGQPSCQSGLYDPNVVYDEEAQRWIVLYDKGAFSQGGGFCVAASQSSDPTGAWNVYFFNVNTAAGWADYPHTGVGDSYIVTGANIFNYVAPPNTGYVEARIWAFDKSDLYAGNAVTPVTRGLGSIYFTPQPLNLHGFADNTWPNYGNTHYVLAGVYNGSDYSLLQWNPSNGSFTVQGSINLGSAGQPIPNPQNGGSLITGNDWRLLDFEYRNGFGWTTNTISCNPGSGTVNCIRWAQIDIASAQLGPAGVGIIASNGNFRYFGDLAVNECDDALIGYTASSNSTFPGVYVALRQSNDPAGAISGESLVKDGEVVYTAFDSPPRRWGDYTGMTIDPDGETFWYMGQYSEDTGTTNGRWGTYIASGRNVFCNFNATDFVYLPLMLNE